MALRKVTPGQRLRIPAEAYNGLVDLLNGGGANPPGESRAQGNEEGPPEELMITDILSTETANLKWKYKVKRVVNSFSSTNWTGAETATIGFEFEGRNTWEGLAKAGYVASNVTGLRPIPTGSVVTGRRISISGATFYRFSERNEPICS